SRAALCRAARPPGAVADGCLQSAIRRPSSRGLSVHFRRRRRAPYSHGEKWHHSWIVSQSRRRPTHTKLLMPAVLARRSTMLRLTVIARGSAQCPWHAGALVSLVLLSVSGCGGAALVPVSARRTE